MSGLTDKEQPKKLRARRLMMKQKTTTSQLEASADSIVAAVRETGDCYIISDGESDKAALVPLGVLEAFERSRIRAGQVMNAMSAISNLPPEDAVRLAMEEVELYRRERRQSSDHNS